VEVFDTLLLLGILVPREGCLGAFMNETEVLDDRIILVNEGTVCGDVNIFGSDYSITAKLKGEAYFRH
jgi:hypothetical protein